MSFEERLAQIGDSGNTSSFDQRVANSEAPPEEDRFSARVNAADRVTQDLARSGADPIYNAPGSGVPNSTMGPQYGTFGSAIQRGVTNTGGLLAETAELFGDQFDIESLTEFGEEGIRNALLQGAMNPAEQPLLEDAEGFAEIGTWALERLGEQGANLAFMAGTALATKAAVGVGGAALGLGFTARVGASVWANLAGRIGAGGVGGYAGSTALSIGEVSKEFKEAGVKPQFGKTVTGGLLVGAVDYASIIGIYKRTFGGAVSGDVAHAYTKHILNTMGISPGKFLKEAAKPIAKNVVASSVQEGVTEAVQEGLIMNTVTPLPAAKIMAAIGRKFKDPTYEILEDTEVGEAVSRLMNAAAAGAVVGGGISMAGGTVSVGNEVLNAKARRDNDQKDNDAAVKEIDEIIPDSAAAPVSETSGRKSARLFDFDTTSELVGNAITKVSDAFKQAKAFANDKSETAQANVGAAAQAAEGLRQEAVAELTGLLNNLEIAESMGEVKARLTSNLSRLSDRIASLPAIGNLTPEGIATLNKVRAESTKVVNDLKSRHKEAVVAANKGDTTLLRQLMKDTLVAANDLIIKAEDMPGAATAKQLKVLTNMVESLNKTGSVAQNSKLQAAKKKLFDALDQLDAWSEELSPKLREEVAKARAREANAQNNDNAANIDGVIAKGVGMDNIWVDESEGAQEAAIDLVLSGRKQAALITGKNAKLSSEEFIAKYGTGLVRIASARAGGVFVVKVKDQAKVRAHLANNDVGAALDYDAPSKQDFGPTDAPVVVSTSDDNGNTVQDVLTTPEGAKAAYEKGQETGPTIIQTPNEGLNDRLKTLYKSLKTDIQNSHSASATIYRNVHKAFKRHKMITDIPDSTVLHGDFTIGDLREYAPITADSIIENILFDPKLKEVIADLADGTTFHISHMDIVNAQQGERVVQMYYQSRNNTLKAFDFVIGDGSFGNKEQVPESIAVRMKPMRSEAAAERKIAQHKAAQDKRGKPTNMEFRAVYNRQVRGWLVEQSMPTNYDELILERQIDKINEAGNKIPIPEGMDLVNTPWTDRLVWMSWKDSNGKVRKRRMHIAGITKLGKLSRGLRSVRTKQSHIDIKGDFQTGLALLLDRGFELPKGWPVATTKVLDNFSSNVTWGELTEVQYELTRLEEIMQDPTTTVAQKRDAKTRMKALGIDSTSTWESDDDIVKAIHMVRKRFIEAPTKVTKKWAEDKLNINNKNIPRYKKDLEAAQADNNPVSARITQQQIDNAKSENAVLKQILKADTKLAKEGTGHQWMNWATHTLASVGISPIDALQMTTYGIHIELDPDVAKAQMEARAIDMGVEDNAHVGYDPMRILPLFSTDKFDSEALEEPSGADKAGDLFESSKHGRMAEIWGVSGESWEAAAKVLKRIATIARDKVDSAILSRTFDDAIGTAEDHVEVVENLDAIGNLVDDMFDEKGTKGSQVIDLTNGSKWGGRVGALLKRLGVNANVVLVSEKNAAAFGAAVRGAVQDRVAHSGATNMELLQGQRIGSMISTFDSGRNVQSRTGFLVTQEPAKLGLKHNGMSIIYIPENASFPFVLGHELGHLVHFTLIENAPKQIRELFTSIEDNIGTQNMKEVLADVLARRIQAELGLKPMTREDTLADQKQLDDQIRLLGFGTFVGRRKITTFLTELSAAWTTVIKWAQAQSGYKDTAEDLFNAIFTYNKYSSEVGSASAETLADIGNLSPNGKLMFNALYTGKWDRGGKLKHPKRSSTFRGKDSHEGISDLQLDGAWGIGSVSNAVTGVVDAINDKTKKATDSLDIDSETIDKKTKDFVDGAVEWASKVGKMWRDNPSGAARGIFYPMGAELRSMGKFASAFARMVDPLPGEKGGESIFAQIERTQGPFHAALMHILNDIPNISATDAMRAMVDPTFDGEGIEGMDRIREIQNILLLEKDSNDETVLKVRALFKNMHAWYTTDPKLVPLVQIKVGDRAIGLEPLGLALEERKNYFPAMANTEVMTNKLEDFVQILITHERMNRTEAENVAKNIARGTEDGLLNSLDGGIDNDDIYGPAFGFGKQRKFKKDTHDAMVRAGLYHTDIGTVITMYTSSLVRRGVWSSRFSEDFRDYDKKQLRQRLARYKRSGVVPTDPLAKLKLGLQEATVSGDLSAWQAARFEQDILPAALGRMGMGMSQAARKVMSGLVVYQNVRLLGLSLLSSFVDYGTLLNRAGKASFSEKGLHKLIREANTEDAQAMAQLLGILRDGITNHILNDQVLSSYMSSGARNANELFFRMNGMQGWTNIMRTTAMLTGREFLIRHSRLANQGDLTSLRYLEELGVTPELIDGWDGQSLEDQKIARALNNFVDQAMIRPTPGNRPVWMSDPYWALLAHLKGFMYGFYTTFLRRTFYESAEGYKVGGIPGALMPLVMLGVMTLPFAAAGWELRRKITGATSTVSGLSYMMEVTERAGLYGPFQMVLDMEGANSFGKPFMMGALGPTLEQGYDFITKDASYTVPRAFPIVSIVPALR